MSANDEVRSCIVIWVNTRPGPDESFVEVDPTDLAEDIVILALERAIELYEDETESIDNEGG